MSNELTIPQDQLTSELATQEIFKRVTSQNYLPRIQIMGANSEIVKQAKFPIGHFALIRDQQFIDLTPEFNAWVLSWRPKAMTFKPQVISAYDPESDEFKKIQERSNQPQSNCGWGVEFLLYLPDHDTFATLFLGNKTGRREAANVVVFLGKKITLAIKYIKSQSYSWHGSEAKTCSIDLSPPPEELFRDILEKFKHPPVVEVELVDDADHTRE